jgi:hypothetical protein
LIGSVLARGSGRFGASCFGAGFGIGFGSGAAIGALGSAEGIGAAGCG